MDLSSQKSSTLTTWNIYPDAGITVGLGDAHSGVPFHVGRLRLTQWRQVFHGVKDVCIISEAHTSTHKKKTSNKNEKENKYIINRQPSLTLVIPELFSTTFLLVQLLISIHIKVNQLALVSGPPLPSPSHYWLFTTPKSLSSVSLMSID